MHWLWHWNFRNPFAGRVSLRPTRTWRALIASWPTKFVAKACLRERPAKPGWCGLTIRSSRARFAASALAGYDLTIANAAKRPGLAQALGLNSKQCRSLKSTALYVPGDPAVRIAGCARGLVAARSGTRSGHAVFVQVAAISGATPRAWPARSSPLMKAGITTPLLLRVSA